MKKLIVFDWDDVFTLGAKDGYMRCLRRTLQELNVRLDPQEEHRRIQQTWSTPHREELSNLLREAPERVNEACEIYERLFFDGEYINSLRLVDGARELLESLRGKYVLAVATGAHPVVLKEGVFVRFSIPNVFAEVLSTYDISNKKHHKPHPYMLTKIMADVVVRPEEAIYVGDAQNDVLMAQAANVTPVAVLTGHLTRKDAEEMGVRFIIRDVTELPAVLYDM